MLPRNAAGKTVKRDLQAHYLGRNEKCAAAGCGTEIQASR